MVKVDDTEPGIAEGRAAGTWTVGVAVSGNALGLSAGAMGGARRRQRSALSGGRAGRVAATGADYVIDSIADLLPVIDAIEAKLKQGSMP